MFNLIRKPLINNQIRVQQVRLIDKTGKQVGILPVGEALQMAKERNLDLVQITAKVNPPVCKIIDYGKYLYALQKKERKGGIKLVSKIKEIRFGPRISLYDMETKAKTIQRFLEKKNKVKIEMILKGREKALSEFAKEKLKQFLEILEKLAPIKIERELKREPRGFTLIISKK